MAKKIISKIFASSFIELSEKPQKIERFLKDKRPTIQEKEILKLFILIRDHKHDEIISRMTSINSTDDFVSGVRALVLGISLNNHGRFQAALESLKSALKLLTPYQAGEIKFICLFNHFICYLNLRNLPAARELRDMILNYEVEGKGIITKLRVGCLMALYDENKTEARSFIAQLEKHKAGFTELQRASFFYDKFRLLILEDKLQEARASLEEMKLIRKYYSTSNYSFMKGILDFLLDHKPIYLYESDFPNAPNLWWEISVLQHLEAKDLEAAKGFWKKLHEMSPAAYGEPFKFLGGKCLFSVALNTFKAVNAPAPVLSNLKTKEEKIVQLLTSSDGVRKEDLFQAIYGEPLLNKDDLDKLKNIVTRIRKKFGLEIKSRKGCYYIQKEVRKAS